MPVSNPVDLWPAVERHGAEKSYQAALKAVCSDPAVDAVFVHAFSGGFDLNLEIEQLAKEAKAAGKPLFCWLLGQKEDALKFQLQCSKAAVPVFREISRAVECMDALFSRTRSKVQSEKKPVSMFTGSIRTADQEKIKSDQLHAVVKDEYVSKHLLSSKGIPVVKEYIAGSVDQAVNAASELGFPVVMKGLLQDTVHKTEAGLVRLNIHSHQAVEKQFNLLEKRMAGQGRVLIAQQIKSDLELIAGLVHDVQFGACVMLGMGGVMAEVLDDAVFGVAPLNHDQSLDLIKRLKNQKILNGFRGAEKADRGKIADILVKIGQIGYENPEISEIDINPLLVSCGEPIAVDASIICF